MVELSIRVDDVEMNSFGADGVIVSTPTGSTACAFSAGGPVVMAERQGPAVDSVGRTPLFARPLIIGSGSTFTIDILDDSMSEGWICCDGRRQRTCQGTRVMVRESRDTLRLARLSGVPFPTVWSPSSICPWSVGASYAATDLRPVAASRAHVPQRPRSRSVTVTGDAGVPGTEPDKARRTVTAKAGS